MAYPIVKLLPTYTIPACESKRFLYSFVDPATEDGKRDGGEQNFKVSGFAFQDSS